MFLTKYYNLQACFYQNNSWTRPLTKKKQDSRTIDEPEKSMLHKEINILHKQFSKNNISRHERDTKNPMPIPFPSRCK